MKLSEHHMNLGDRILENDSERALYHVWPQVKNLFKVFFGNFLNFFELSLCRFVVLV